MSDSPFMEFSQCAKAYGLRPRFNAFVTDCPLHHANTCMLGLIALFWRCLNHITHKVRCPITEQFPELHVKQLLTPEQYSLFLTLPFNWFSAVTSHICRSQTQPKWWKSYKATEASATSIWFISSDVWFTWCDGMPALRPHNPSPHQLLHPVNTADSGPRGFVFNIRRKGWNGIGIRPAGLTIYVWASTPQGRGETAPFEAYNHPKAAHL